MLVPQRPARLNDRFALYNSYPGNNSSIQSKLRRQMQCEMTTVKQVGE